MDSSLSAASLAGTNSSTSSFADEDFVSAPPSPTPSEPDVTTPTAPVVPSDAFDVHLTPTETPSGPQSEGDSFTTPPSPTLSNHSTHRAQNSNGPSSADSPTIVLHPAPRGSRRSSTINTIIGQPLTNHRSETATVASTHLPNAPNRPENSRASTTLDHQPVGHAPFTFEPAQLAHMVENKSIDSLVEFGGVDGLLRGLGTDRVHGLSTKPPSSTAGPTHASTPPNSTINVSISDRQRVYGANSIPSPQVGRFAHFLWITIKDKTLVSSLLSAALVLGLSMCEGPTLRSLSVWKSAAAVIVAHILLVILSSLNDWHRERQLNLVNHAHIGRQVTVIRDGAETIVDAKDVVVGDIALLQPGDIIPVDGVFLSGHNVRCDESRATGESDVIMKMGSEECVGAAGLAASKSNTSPRAPADCFLVSGSTVLEGCGMYIVVAVGTWSWEGRIRSALECQYDHSPTQISLNGLSDKVARAGSIVGLCLFVALMIEFFVTLGRGTPKRSPIEHGIEFVNIWLITTTLVVVAIPTGLPLAMTLALSFAMKHMSRARLHFKSYSACETSGEVSLVCTSSTGVLTQNHMTVVAGSVGIHAKFVRQLNPSPATTPSTPDPPTSPTPEQPRKHADDFCVQISQMPVALLLALLDLLNESIALNTTAFEDVDPETGSNIFMGSRREAALLSFARELGRESYKTTRTSKAIVYMIPFSSVHKGSAIVIMNPHGGYRVYIKGASEILAKKCTRVVKVSRDSGGDDQEVETEDLDAVGMDNISRTIISYGNEGLRSISLCYKDLPEWPPRGSIDTPIPYDDLASDLTLLAVLGIEDPLREGVRETVANLKSAGVTTKMCTGENVLTARQIALQVGIFTPGGIIMEGAAFRDLHPADKVEILPRLQVLARASPEDRRELIQALKALGEVVACVSGGADDGSALMAANVGFSTGIAGTEAAKEASDIILMDDGFRTMYQAILWGRSFVAAIRRLLQFVLTTVISAVVVVFVSSVASAGADPALTPVQLLWVTLIMDTLGSLALVTDRPSPRLWTTKPQKTPLFSTAMYKQIIAQCLYQIVITLVFHFAGIRLLRLEGDPTLQRQVLDTLVFNFYIFSQIFNTLNCRVADKSYNVFHRIFGNPYFIVIALIEIMAQAFIVSFGGPALNVTRMNAREWAISVGLGAGTLVLGLVVRFSPDSPFDAAFRKLGMVPDPSILPVFRPGAWSYGSRISNQESLSAFAFLRGGRLMSSAPRVITQPEPYTPPTLKNASDVLRALADPTNFNPTLSDNALWQGMLQLHPDTSHDDPTYQTFVTDAYAVRHGHFMPPTMVSLRFKVSLLKK